MNTIKKLRQYDVVIIGAGVMGASTAYWLSKTGKSVLLLDQFPFQNQKNSSRDYSRSFRVHYGSDLYYSEMAIESLALWRSLEKDLGKRFYTPTGKLLLADSEDDYAFECFSALRSLGSKVTVLKENTMRKRFPQFSAKLGVVDENGGVIDASNFVQSLLDAAIENGVEAKENTRVKKIEGSEIYTADGQVIRAGRIVVTAGAWVNKLATVPVTPTRQQVLYLKPNDLDSFSPERFPVFSHMEKGFYGIPVWGVNGVKVSNHHPGKPTDPDHDDRNVDIEFIEQTRAFLRKRLPSLADAEIMGTKVCFYSGTTDRGFIMDELNDSTIIASGFSGHGFKFSPLIGKWLAEAATDGKVNWRFDRFGLQRFADSQITAGAPKINAL